MTSPIVFVDWLIGVFVDDCIRQMSLTRQHPSVVQEAKQQPLRRQFQTVVVVLSCYYLLLLSPKLITDLYLTASPAPENQQLSPLSVPSVISTDRQMVVFLCRFLFHVYVACKLFVFCASCSAFRQSLVLMVTCSCCGTRHNDVILRLRWCVSSSRLRDLVMLRISKISIWCFNNDRIVSYRPPQYRFALTYRHAQFLYLTVDFILPDKEFSCDRSQTD